MKLLKYLTLSIMVTGLVALAACGGGDNSSTGEQGIVQLALTDAVDHNFSAVVISIKEVRAVPAGEEGAAEGGLPLIVSFDPPKVVNVLELAYQQEFLGEAALNAGEYNQLRLVLSRNTDPNNPANYLVMADDDAEVKIPLKTPSGQESGLKVIGKFEVNAGEISAVVLDFDPNRAVVKAGQSGLWLFKPTGIRVVQMDEVLLSYGAITGTVVQAVTAEEEDGLVENGEELENGVVVENDNELVDPTTVPVTEALVYALPENSDVAIAAGAVNSDDGTFRLLLPAGNYSLTVVASGFEPYPDPAAAPFFYAVEIGEDIEAGDLMLVPLAEAMESEEE